MDVIALGRKLSRKLPDVIGRIRLKKVKSTRSLTGNVVNVLFLFLLSGIMLIPLLYVINTAFKPQDELFVFPPRIFVVHPTLDNIKDLFTIMGNSWVPITRYLFNTVFCTAAGTALHVILASMAAYVLEKHNFPGSKLFFAIVITTLMFSKQITDIPNIIVLTRLGLIDTYAAPVLISAARPLGLFLMKQFMSVVQDSMLEAARLEGARESHIFFKIVMPIVKPAWLTLIILTVQMEWNSTYNILIQSEALKPLPYALNQVLSSGGFARAGAFSAVGLLLLVVPVTIFVLCQRRILDTMAMSGLKE